MNQFIRKAGILYGMTMLLSSMVYAQDLPFCISLQTNEFYTPPVEKDFQLNKPYVPYVKVFLPEKEKATGRAVVICPGGGYGMVAFGHEGTRWAGFYNDLGIAAIVVKYRLPHGDYKIPVSDAETAMQIVKDSADVWNINRDDVGIMGFSAGGHLASTIATHTDSVLRPNFQILFYPVITMDKSYTHLGSHDSFLGKDASKEMEDLFSNEKQVTASTPPAFITLAADDKVVPPTNGINYFQALIKNNIYATLHVYPIGNHGWGYRRSYRFNQAILDELTLWLENIDKKKK
ncbi:alpha/beta hydrolase [Plebeiibacterium marinum]|uniref:Alpha/beta hydrolase n=1 Tax=Plebeiibacterium marinum TaxID=2992111 RepID=A0AAE3MHY1_9BACT|nr:alpha/beta hydrolase [Plebeiobacterium marinum]MCW3807750.1 alpha/beta hydrolase [Plebeiobacterium marinum]